MPYFSMAIRSIPMPKAKPCHLLGIEPAGCDHIGMHHAASRGSRASRRRRRSGAGRPSQEQPMSTSIDGSVKGKCEARKRIFTSSTSKNALQNSSSTHFRWPSVSVAVDHEPFDLVEHRRVGLVVVGGRSRPGAMMRIGGVVRLHRADLHRRGMGAQHHAACRRAGRGNRTCRAPAAPDAPAGCSGRRNCTSRSRYAALRRPRSRGRRRSATTSSRPGSPDGCVPSAAGRGGKVTSSRSAASRASSAASREHIAPLASALR